MEKINKYTNGTFLLMDSLESYRTFSKTSEEIHQDENGMYKIETTIEETPCSCHTETCCHFDGKKTISRNKKIYLAETSKDTDTKSEFKQKRISLTHGSARVDENCPQGTIDALNKISEIAYNSPSPTSEYKEWSEITNYYPLFQHLHEEHGLILLDSEMQEIVSKFPALSQLEAVKREKEAIYRQAYFDGLSGYPVDSEWYNSAKDIALSKHQSQSPISIPKDIEINPE